ncbi:MAG: Hsp20/alpha crystallin family protein [Planctomycetaceae bacterium]|nr:Hsp20/alpha crystallin family protein [Planctomycetaceae bacterium]
MTERQLSKRNLGRDYPMMRNWETPFQSIQQAMNRIFNDFWNEPSALAEWEGRFIPAVDISEDDKMVHLAVELPGMNEKDITVTARDNAVILEGEKKREYEEKKENFYRHESTYGNFYRRIELPAEVDEDKAQAKFEKGILFIDLPKTEAARQKEKKIEIKTK